MKREQILSILYEMALLASGETQVLPLLTKTLQRLLYHTNYPSGIYLSFVDDAGDALVTAAHGKERVRVLLAMGNRQLMAEERREVDLPVECLHNRAGYITKLDGLKPLLGEMSPYHYGLMLPVPQQGLFVLLSKQPPFSEMPFAQVFQPVLSNLSKAIGLCRGNELNTERLQREVELHAATERALRQSEQNLRLVFEHVLDGIVVFERDGQIISANPASESMLGYSAGEIVGTSLLDRIPQIGRHLSEGVSHGVAKQLRIDVTRLDGSSFVARMAVSSLRTLERTLMIAVIQDVTEQSRYEEGLRVAREQAEKANRAKSVFLSSMSHELRTPLNAILGFAQLTEMEVCENTTHGEYAREIQGAGSHLLNLVNDVLDLARIESGKMQMAMEAVSVGEVCNQCLSLARPLADSRGIKLALENRTPKDSSVLADITRLSQVLINLVSNAIKYNKEHGEVTVGCEVCPNDNIRFFVRDTGLGIPADKLSQIFQPFNRLGAESSNIEGTGIGLVITKQLVEMMNGRLEIDSELGQGSTFSVEFLAGEQQAAESFADSRTENHISDLLSRTYTVVCVEDNPANIRLLKNLFKRYPTIQLHTASDGVQGLHLILQQKVDVVVLDINLPEIDGFEVLRRLRANPATANLPVIGVSANAMPDDLRRAQSAGFTAYLTKPIKVMDFDEVLFSALSQAIA